MSKKKDRQGTLECPDCNVKSTVTQDDITKKTAYEKGTIVYVEEQKLRYHVKAKKDIKQSYIQCPMCKNKKLIKPVYAPRPPLDENEKDWEIAGIDHYYIGKCSQCDCHSKFLRTPTGYKCKKCKWYVRRLKRGGVRWA